MKIIKQSVSKRTRKNKKSNYVARVIWTDDTGRTRETTKTAATKTDAKDLLRDMVIRFERSHGAELEAGKVTLFDLLDYFTRNFAKEAVITDGRKISGYRDVRTIKTRLGQIRKYFPNKKIQQIRYDDLRIYRQRRASEISESTNKVLTTASVNREMSLLKRLFNIARQNGWIFTSPFVHGESLIDVSGEKKRERVLTSSEEKKLIEASEIPECPFLKPFLIALLDTGARAGEMMRLTWKDIDFNTKTITFIAENTKTLTKRRVGITERVETELTELFKKAAGDIVFPFKYEHFFRQARKLAGLDEVRVHDLRHTAATRLVRQGLSISEAGRILGHVRPETTYRYVNSDSVTRNNAVNALETYSDDSIQEISSVSN